MAMTFAWFKRQQPRFSFPIIAAPISSPMCYHMVRSGIASRRQIATQSATRSSAAAHTML
jgi:hypothetical protein